MESKSTRKLPRPFTLHWGSGQIVEEASYVGRYHQPALQLLEYDDGSLAVRFCYYDHHGRFQRSPLMVGDEEIAGLRGSLDGCPRLRGLLRKMVA